MIRVRDRRCPSLAVASPANRRCRPQVQMPPSSIAPEAGGGIGRILTLPLERGLQPASVSERTGGALLYGALNIEAA